MPNPRPTSNRRGSQKERSSEGASRARIRCAIYTRKSSEEGLEQRHELVAATTASTSQPPPSSNRRN